jgi:hypothetical protein
MIVLSMIALRSFSEYFVLVYDLWKKPQKTTVDLIVTEDVYGFF